MRHYNKSQTDQGKVLDNYCHMAFVLIASASKVTLLQLLSYQGGSSIEYEIC